MRMEGQDNISGETVAYAYDALEPAGHSPSFRCRTRRQPLKTRHPTGSLLWSAKIPSGAYAASSPRMYSWCRPPRNGLSSR
jgi:hypothetical protein